MRIDGSTSARGDTDVVAALDGNARLDHVAVAARRIRDMLPLYLDAFGGRFFTGGDNVAAGYRAVVLAFDGGSNVELLEPHPGSTFLDSFFARHPYGGVHHVTFIVDDFEAALFQLQARNFPLLGLDRSQPERQEVFVHPRGAQGTLVQVVHEAPDYPPRIPTIGDVLAGRGVRGTGIPSS